MGLSEFCAILLGITVAVFAWSVYFTFNRRIERLERDKYDVPCGFMLSDVVNEYKPCLEPCFKFGKGICYRRYPCQASEIVKRQKVKSKLMGVYKNENDRSS